jgi:hypothetical protein
MLVINFELFRIETALKPIGMRATGTLLRAIAKPHNIVTVRNGP